MRILWEVQEPLARIYFSAYPICHDVNLATVCPERIDVIIGFNTADLLWFGKKYAPLRYYLFNVDRRSHIFTLWSAEQTGAKRS